MSKHAPVSVVAKDVADSEGVACGCCGRQHRKMHRMSNGAVMGSRCAELVESVSAAAFGGIMRAALLMEAVVANRDLDGDLNADEMGDLAHARTLISGAQKDGWLGPSDYVALWEVAKAANEIRRDWAFGKEPDSRQWPAEARLYRALECAGFSEKRNPESERNRAAIAKARGGK